MRTDLVVYLTSVNGGRIAVMKALGKHLGLDLKSARKALDDLPLLLAEGLDVEAARQLEAQFAALDCDVRSTVPEYVSTVFHKASHPTPLDEDPELEDGPLVLAASVDGLEEAESVADACDDACPVARMRTGQGEALVFSDGVTGHPMPSLWGRDGDVLWIVRVITDAEVAPSVARAAATLVDTGVRVTTGSQAVLADAGSGVRLATLDTPAGEAAVWFAAVEVDDGEYQVFELRWG